MEPKTIRTFVAYVEDVPGVLNRVSSLFRRRTYNIVSLTVGRTNDAGFSRMTIVVEADAYVARLIEANLYKLVNVVSVEDITGKPHVTRDVALVKVRTTPETRAALCQHAEKFRARIVDVADDAMTMEVTGNIATIDGLVKELEPYGIVEMAQSGAVAMTRGGVGEVASRASFPPPPDVVPRISVEGHF